MEYYFVSDVRMGNHEDDDDKRVQQDYRAQKNIKLLYDLWG